ncbi:MAG: serine protease [Planctomycetes bacterium]|nr:serine protease [Planctomycetota bacterium]
MTAQRNQSWGSESDPMGDSGEFGGGEFENIELPGEEPSAPAEVQGLGAGAESMAAAPEPLLAARDELARRLLLDVAVEALSAESGTSTHGFENIVGVGVGEKMVGGEYTDEECVTVYVAAKTGKDEVASDARVPASVGGFATDVVATGEFHAQPYRGRYRPVPAGVSIAHTRVTAGTVGCLVRRGRQLYILSNNHVLANSNHAAQGDLIVQPGPADGGRAPRDAVARLSKWVPINFAPAALNFVDCAIAQTNPDLVTRRNICYGNISPTPAAATRLMLVKKGGRTTQCTRGIITDVNAVVRVNYGVGVATFANQIIIRSLTGGSFSQGGDSGSLILSLVGSQPVALLFAGSASHTIANPIGRVLGALGVSIVA